jgi:hypothetical protein
MNTKLPSAAEVRAALQPLTMRQIDWLADASSVSPRALLNIRYGTTLYPGLDTVRAFLPHLRAAQRAMK